VSDARLSQIATALTDVRSRIPSHVTLIVVTKTFPTSDVEILYHLGERNFGENRDSEGSEKSLQLRRLYLALPGGHSKQQASFYCALE